MGLDLRRPEQRFIINFYLSNDQLEKKKNPPKTIINVHKTFVKLAVKLSKVENKIQGKQRSRSRNPVFPDHFSI